MFTNITNNVTLSFSGKRKYEQLNRLEPELETLFQMLDQAVNGVHFQLLTGCADGADQIATSLVLKATFNNTQNLWSTGGVFPFQQSDYVDTMDDPIAYEALYQRLKQKLHLDGHYVKGAEGKEARVKAYRQQGQVLARFADVFIAASTRSENINGGGTLENVIVALKLAKPVIFYDLQEHQFYLFQHVDEFLLKDDSNLNKYAVTVEELVNWFERLIRPEYDSDIYLIKPSGGLLFKCRKQAWIVFERLFYREKPRFEPEFRKPILEKLKIIYNTIEDLRRPISEKANYFQIHYRGSYMLNYIAAMAAVCVAVLAMMYYIYSLRYWYHIYWPLIVFGLIKIVILLIIIINTHESNKTNYNALSIQYRYLSERLKFNQYSVIGGLFNPINPTIGKHDEIQLRKNPAEKKYQDILSVFKVTLSYTLELTSQDVIDYSDYIKHWWYQEQINYHTRVSNRYSQLFHQIEKASEFLSKTVLGVVSFEILLETAEHFHWFGEVSSILAEIFGPPLLGIATFLPAVVIILIAINFHQDGKKLSTRYQNQVLAIERLKDRFPKLSSIEQGCLFIKLLEQLDEMGQLMIDEVADWSILYDNKVYEP